MKEAKWTKGLGKTGTDIRKTIRCIREIRWPVSCVVRQLTAHRKPAWCGRRRGCYFLRVAKPPLIHRGNRRCRAYNVLLVRSGASESWHPQAELGNEGILIHSIDNQGQTSLDQTSGKYFSTIMCRNSSDCRISSRPFMPSSMLIQPV